MADNDVGRFVWYDLMSPDTDASKAFYTKVLGWGTALFEIEGRPPYTMWVAGQTPVGGMVPFEEGMEGMPPHWLAHVVVQDVDKSVKLAKQLGGKVLSPAEEIPTVGRLAVLEDPQGGSFGVFKPSPDSPPVKPFGPKLLEFSWNELGTTDWRKAMEFYQKMFGWQTISEDDMGALGVYAIFGQDGHSYGGVFTKPPEMPRTSWCYYVRVQDVKATADKVKQHGGQVINGPMEVPGGDWIAQCLDSLGGMFALHQVLH
jgi:predicted enzyme related to lactoylglutathione lyase